MLRSLHLKLMLIMLLLITSLMTVVGAFLMTNVSGFYTDTFYEQMKEVFDESNADFVNSLRAEAAQNDGVARLQTMIEAHSGSLGIDMRSRNYYILDAATGKCLAGSDATGGEHLQDTANLLAARRGEVGQRSDITASYMDVAIPISGGGNDYIIYILDTRENANDLNSQLFMIILQALLIGLMISVLLSFLLSKTMTLPIERLTTSAEHIAAGDFGSRIDVESNDEIGILTTTFNEMSDTLQSTLNEVKNERNKLDTLFLHMTDGVVAFSRDRSIMQYNPAAVQMLRDGNMEALTYDDLFQSKVDFSHVMALHSPFYEDCEYAVDDTILEVHLTPFSNETSGGVLAVLHDVTQQRKDQEIRREFVANVSHELRTPLTNVRSYAETLHDSSDVPPEMANSFLDVILSETDRMTHIVQDLLTLSKFDYGHMEMSMSRFPLTDAVDDVCNAVEMAAKSHNHTLIRNYPTLPVITADRGRLTQVIMNIVGNAIKYTPDGGRIEISGGADNDSVWLEVSDNGLGIPPADRTHVFERFYRVDKARSRESGGTGLGLSIASEIIAQHHGVISLVERDGPGTTFRITLPIWQEPQEDDHAEEE